MVVTMRPIPPKLVSRAVQITSRFPKAHGAPVHVGDGASIGIPDLTKIDLGKSLRLRKVSFLSFGDVESPPKW